MLGDATRSKRVGSAASLASTWKSAFDAVPQKELLVVHGTVFVPPWWIVVQPAGKVPGATPLKSSENTVAATGVPVSSLNRSVVLPPPLVVTARERSIRAPGTKAPAS